MGLTQVSTDGVKNDAITKTKIPANQIEASELADNAVDTNAIANNAVTAGKLASGVQTTINNNADNRVITGSGTANTLNGESGLTFDGSNLGLNGDLVASNNATLYSSNGGSGVRAGISLSGSNQTLKFFTVNGGSERMRIDSSGKVGIGTTSPSHKLHVEDSVSNVIVAKQTTNNGGHNTFAGVDSFGNVKFYATHNGRVGAADGIIFGSDTAAANILDDYEEGTFSPTFGAANGSSTTTYTTQQGAYTKVGNTVFFNIYLVINSISTNTHNVIVIGNLPFQNAGNRVAIHSIRSSGFQGSGDDSRPFAGTVEVNATKIELVKAVNGGTSDFTTSNSQGGSIVYISGQYPVS